MNTCPAAEGCKILINSFELAEQVAASGLNLPDSPADIPDPADELSMLVESGSTEAIASLAPGGKITEALLGFLAAQAPRLARCSTCPLNPLEDRLQIRKG
jgi:hypothetical protein